MAGSHHARLHVCGAGVCGVCFAALAHRHRHPTLPRQLQAGREIDRHVPTPPTRDQALVRQVQGLRTQLAVAEQLAQARGATLKQWEAALRRLAARYDSGSLISGARA